MDLNSSESTISPVQYILYFNFKMSFYFCMITGAIAAFLFFNDLDILVDGHSAWVIQASPVAYIVYLFGFNLFYMLIVKHMGYGYQKFAFFSGLFSMGCLFSALVILYVFPEIGFDIEPELLYGIPESVFVYFFLYIGLSNLAFAALGNRLHH